jgi:hypothetical protein
MIVCLVDLEIWRSRVRKGKNKNKRKSKMVKRKKGMKSRIIIWIRSRRYLIVVIMGREIEKQTPKLNKTNNQVLKNPSAN